MLILVFGEVAGLCPDGRLRATITPVIPFSIKGKIQPGHQPTAIFSPFPFTNFPIPTRLFSQPACYLEVMSQTTELTNPQWPRPRGPIVRNRIVHSAGFVFSNQAFCFTAATRCVNELPPAPNCWPMMASFLQMMKNQGLLPRNETQAHPHSLLQARHAFPSRVG